MTQEQSHLPANRAAMAAQLRRLADAVVDPRVTIERWATAEEIRAAEDADSPAERVVYLTIRVVQPKPAPAGRRAASPQP